MKTLTKKCAWFVIGAFAAALVSSAADSAATNVPPTAPIVLSENTITNLVVIDPTNAAEYAELKTKEASLMAQQHELEQKIFKVFRSLHVSQEEAKKGDQELVEMARDIAKKQAELEKRTAEKYPELGKQAQERDVMTKEHASMRQQLREVRKRMDIIEGRLPAEVKTAKP